MVNDVCIGTYYMRRRKVAIERSALQWRLSLWCRIHHPRVMRTFACKGTHIHTLSYYYNIIGICTEPDLPTNIYICIPVQRVSEPGVVGESANRLVRLSWARRRLSVSFNAFLKHRTDHLSGAPMKILLHNNMRLFIEGKKCIIRIRARATNSYVSLFSRLVGGGGCSFFLLLNSCRGTVNSSARSTIIILLLRMNESRVAVFFFTGIRNENGWRIDNETRARSRNYEPDSGGSEIIVCNLNRETRRFGWNVSVEIYLIRLIIHTRLITRFKKIIR